MPDEIATASYRDPRVSIVVTSTGTKLGPAKSLTAKGRCVIHEDQETKDWFYPAFASHLHRRDEQAAKDFVVFLDSPMRVVLEVIPEKWITYDGVKMALDTAGKLPQEKKGPLLESDALRFEQERKRRGLR